MANKLHMHKASNPMPNLKIQSLSNKIFLQ